MGVWREKTRRGGKELLRQTKPMTMFGSVQVQLDFLEARLLLSYRPATPCPLSWPARRLTEPCSDARLQGGGSVGQCCAVFDTAWTGWVPLSSQLLTWGCRCSGAEHSPPRKQGTGIAAQHPERLESVRTTDSGDPDPSPPPLPPAGPPSRPRSPESRSITDCAAALLGLQFLDTSLPRPG